MKGNTLAKDYYMLGTLDEGSFAKVKVAIHLTTQTMVAIKILKRGTNTDFLVISEIEIMKSLYHRHIIQLLQVFETKHKTYLVMEYASRGSLLRYIKKCGHLGEEEASTIFTELSLAVNYIHSQNIVHRDIKAENILLDWEGHVKLTDFGLGKRLASGEKFKGFCGTAQYCAPEVFDHTQYDGLPTDIWSLGVVLYYLCWPPSLPRDSALQDKVPDPIPELLDSVSPVPRASIPIEEINDYRPHNEAIHQRNISRPMAAS
ncbi:LOW QUALITY PROTEIN: sperm motility kinase X-like [Mastomys coucha]|uniref:LOW QUALITY PROTEIN: sperm motility kinase X-like n=1 Tax=Mastomys coucha TaxID=35658 RepID=UPI001261C6FD|nr:LOW QUALITY PROTEIN: sperm motility kinase X-like [Mastomys coucha]